MSAITCENCGRFTDMSRQWYSDELGHGVCNRCADPVHPVSLADRIGYDSDIYDDIDCHPNYDAKSDSVIESTPMDQYADYFEDIQNGGLETYYD